MTDFRSPSSSTPPPGCRAEALPPSSTCGSERGVALVIALLAMLLMTALGMALMLVSETESHQWSFVLRLDGAEAKTVTKQQPKATWENLEPNQSYILSEDEPGEAWVEGTFECNVDGVGAGELLGDGDMQLNLQPADDVVCVKHNAELSGTDEDPVDEPGRAFSLYMPAINR